MKKYDKYRDSGYERIKEIPEDWIVVPLKNLIKQNEGGIWGEDFDDNGVPVLRSTEIDVDGRWNSVGEVVRRKISDNIDKYLLIEGDLLITKSSGSENHIGKTALVNKEIEEMGCVYSNFMQKIRVKTDKLVPKLLFYILNNYLGREQLNYLSSTTTGLRNLNTEVLGNVIIPIGDKNTQHNIVKYLDQKASQIDSVIEKKKELVDKLKEYRQSLITEVVTKGLDPNVKMKDSGIEWIGEIPEIWNIRKLKSVTEVLTCGVASTPDYVDPEIGVPFLSAQNIKNGKLNLDKFNYISKELHNQLTKYKKPKKGDLLQVRVGDVGQSCIVDVDFEFSVYVSLTHIRVKDFIENRYLKYLFNSKIFEEMSKFTAKVGGGIGNLNVTDLELFRMPFPNKKEQIEISNFLDEKVESLDCLIGKQQEKIQKLFEIKRSIISEVVTGKVRIEESDIE